MLFVQCFYKIKYVLKLNERIKIINGWLTLYIYIIFIKNNAFYSINVVKDNHFQ